MEFQLWRSEVNLSKVQKTLAFKMERRANTSEMSDLQVLGKAGQIKFEPDLRKIGVENGL